MNEDSQLTISPTQAFTLQERRRLGILGKRNAIGTVAFVFFAGLLSSCENVVPFSKKSAYPKWFPIDTDTNNNNDNKDGRRRALQLDQSSQEQYYKSIDNIPPSSITYDGSSSSISDTTTNDGGMNDTNNMEESSTIGYNKNSNSTYSFLPLTKYDILGFILAIIGLILAAGGGVGGGGILVPIYILIMKFTPKHAIPLSNITVFGGAVANTLLNSSKRHPHANRPLVDWDLILIMEPLTISGALLGSFMNKVLDERVLVVSLVMLLSFTAYNTLKKANLMYKKESQFWEALSMVDDEKSLDGCEDDDGDGDVECSLTVRSKRSESCDSLEEMQIEVDVIIQRYMKSCADDADPNQHPDTSFDDDDDDDAMPNNSTEKINEEEEEEVRHDAATPKTKNHGDGSNIKHNKKPPMVFKPIPHTDISSNMVTAFEHQKHLISTIQNKKNVPLSQQAIQKMKSSMSYLHRCNSQGHHEPPQYDYNNDNDDDEARDHVDHSSATAHHSEIASKRSGCSSGNASAENLTTSDQSSTLDINTQTTTQDSSSISCSSTTFQSGISWPSSPNSPTKPHVPSLDTTNAALLHSILVEEESIPLSNIRIITVMFLVVLLLNTLKGGGANFPSPLGIQCNSLQFWLSQAVINGWVILVFMYAMSRLLHKTKLKQSCNYPYLKDDILWDEIATLRYPVICGLAGFFAGMFGIGGGIVKGPLMLAMGVHPAVSSATSAAMILYTSFTATTSYVVFGLLIKEYAIVCVCIGFLATIIGQLGMGVLLRRYKRNSYIAYSIGIVVALSAVCMTIESLVSIAGGGGSEDGGGLCGPGE